MGNQRSTEVTRGCIRLGRLIEWDGMAECRFFFQNGDPKHVRVGEPICKDFDSIHEFRAWLESQIQPNNLCFIKSKALEF